jgi:hypothetical protein
MRLSRSEQQALSQALEGVPGPVYLFGSRLHDDRRGGDIDVIVMAPGQPPQERFTLSIRIAARFRSQCDEKIDVHVLDPTALSRTERALFATVDMQPLVTEDLAGTSAIDR